ncbi:MAG: coenzyme F420 hydrogenase/dehydrogenase beta subunit N-terminal domain-containing protein, partial [Pseudomonadota bacterium]
RIATAWAGNADVRFRAATGGVLTALGMYLLTSGQARFILHCGADTRRPMRSRWFFSDTPEEVLARAGSRYGPSDKLAGLEVTLAREEPFAIIAKPCDAGAVRAREKRPAHKVTPYDAPRDGVWRRVRSW